MPRGSWPQVGYDIIKLGGGLDLVTPTLSLAPGMARDATNFEASITGGYSRIAGYERFDGQTSPSSAMYYEMTVTITGTIAAGDTITGHTSAATGYVIAVNGSTVVYTKATGTFIVAESVYVGGSSQGMITALSAGVNTGLLLAAQYQNLASDAYRADIEAVPGSGPVRGVCYYDGKLYAWRDNALADALDMYVESPAGWTKVALGYELLVGSEGGFSGVAVGDTLTGVDSGAYGVITKIMPAYRVFFSEITGTFTQDEVLHVSGVAVGIVAGTQVPIAPLPGGRVEAIVGNVVGAATAKRMYGCDGVNRAFEFDGTVYVQINAGMVSDTPNHIAVHQHYLFLSFGPSVQFSGIGDPYSWTIITGAGELLMPENVNCLLVQPGNQTTAALVIFAETNTYILYGTSAADWNLVPYNVGTGGKAYTAQNMVQAYVFDSRGVMNLATTLNYGNFDTSSLTLNIRPFIQQRRNLAVASGLNREKAQYRVFFSDGYGLYLTIANGQMLGSMPVYFPNAVTCCCEGPIAQGAETMFFGSTNGMVYQLDVGTSFDGADLPASVTLVFNSEGSPRVLKRYRKGSLEITGTGYAQFGFGYDLAYLSTDIGQSQDQAYTTSLTGVGVWDSFTWDAFVWDGRVLAPSEVEICGTAENIAVRISSATDYCQSFTVNSAILHYTPRRGLR